MTTNQQSFDPGLTQKFSGTIRRIINKDGSFNVHRTGVGLQNLHFYQYLINLSWPKFLGIVLMAYLLINGIFACLYFLPGIENLKGAETDTPEAAFMSAFFFSVHTFTTVGYGTIAPKGIGTNLIATFEALTGFMSLALAAGLLYGRFSRPSARIIFSDRALTAPYQGKTSLQFRIANQRTNTLMEMEAKVLLMTVENVQGSPQRKYYALNLERPYIYFFPLTWTIVHPIDESSPLFGKKPEDLAALQAEILILIKGFDDTFSQVVHARYSYRYDEIVWGAKFVPVFHVDTSGDLVVEVDRIGEMEVIEELRQ